MPGGGWSCPHEAQGQCSKVNMLPCDPGMKGCELYGRYVFFDGSKNERLLEKQARARTLMDSPHPEGDSTTKSEQSGNPEAAVSNGTPVFRQRMIDAT